MTTASLHREMVEALRRAAYHKGIKRAIIENCFCGSCATLVSECDASDRLRPGRWCSGPAARAALEGWEKRPRLRDQPELRAVIVAALASSSEERVYVPAILDALEALLYGERG